MVLKVRALETLNTPTLLQRFDAPSFCKSFVQCRLWNAKNVFSCNLLVIEFPFETRLDTLTDYVYPQTRETIVNTFVNVGTISYFEDYETMVDQGAVDFVLKLFRDIFTVYNLQM